MSSKKSLQLQQSTNSMVNSCYPRYQHTAKNSQHLKSQQSVKATTIKSYSLKGAKDSHHSTHQTVSRNSTQRKQKLRKYIFYQRPESKLRTEHSSLSCSTFKNIRINQSASKDNFRNCTQVDSTNNKKKTDKLSTKTKRLPNSREKSTLKIKKIVPKKNNAYDEILNRTKHVLDNYQVEKQNWEMEKQSYKSRITELHSQIDILKEIIALETPTVHKFHNFSIGWQ